MRAGQSWRQSIEETQKKKLSKLEKKFEKLVQKNSKKPKQVVTQSPFASQDQDKIFEDDDSFYASFYEKRVVHKPANPALGVSPAASAANAVMALSLCLEFVQLATFPFQVYDRLYYFYPIRLNNNIEC